MTTDTPQEKNTAPQHTPGPYGYKQARHPADGGYDYGISAIIDGESFCIAETFAVVGEGGRKANAHENAKLFAAAPETAAERDRLKSANTGLFDACQDALAALQTIVETIDPPTTTTPTLLYKGLKAKIARTARAAIAKATNIEGE